MKKTDMVAIGTIAMVACLLFCTPALADYNFDGYPVVTRAMGTVNGGVFVDAIPCDGSKTLTGSFNVPNGDITWARLYTGVFGGTEEHQGWVNVTFNDVYSSNGLGPIHLQGENDTNANVWCSGHGKHWMYYNVTDLVNNGINTATTALINATAGTFGLVYGIVLVVVYEDGDDPKNIQYWINDGSDGLNYNTLHDDGTTYFNGAVDTGSVTEAGLTMAHLTAYEPLCADCLQFNGNVLNTSIVDTNDFELNTWNVTGNVTSSGNDAWYSRGGDGYVNVCNAILTLVSGPEELPDLVVTAIDAYHYTDTPAWFNLGNEIDVTVKNNGTASAGVSNVCLYIDDVFFGKLPVSSLDVGEEDTVTFTGWKPSGVDCLQPPCLFDWSYQNYSLKGVADRDGDVAESNETNNETTVVERVCYNGYMADEPLENVAQGTLRGHILFTTGDGSYTRLNSPGATKDTNYEITLPASATVEHAQLNVYYTWTSPDHACPEMEVRITNSTGTYVLSLENAYNDIKCTCPGPETMYVKSWGNYVFDISDYVTGSDTYMATIENVGSAGHKFKLAAPGIVLVYEDESAPLIDYWVNKGADLLMGGRRADGGNLSLGECINNATFPASTTTGEVATVTLGVVAPWGGDAAGSINVLYFNGAELGWDVYNGYSSPYDETIDSITMSVGGVDAEVGVDVTNVTTQYLKGSANVVGQGDNGDNMMPANAFLVVAYEEEPDLIVSEITPNCGGYLFASESNEICAKIENIGGGDAGAFNVSFVIDGFSTEVRISGLAAGANTTVCINDTTIRNAGDSVTITATADCNGEVSESDELNNESTLDTTVVNNGYKGKRYTGGDDINTWKTFELNGNLVYSLGDSYYLSAYYNPDWTEYNAGWTASDLPIPGTATIVTARLFVPYTWDKAGVMPAYVDVSFNGNAQTLDAHYSDEKSWGTSYPYGMLVYDVTADFDTSGNVANLTNSCPGGDNVSMRGMLLVVVYADDSEPERTIILNEEFDLLYGGASKCTTPEEATAYAPFGSIDVTEVKEATLITVAPGAGDPAEGDLSFNGHMWYDVWNYVGSGTPTPQIGIAETNVTSYLEAADNEANFRSSADYMEASNAFLVVEYETVYLKSDLIVSEITPNCGGYLFASESNEICAKIENIGGGDAGAFNVSFVIDGFSTEVRISGLAAGANTTVCINDTTIRNAGDSVTITATADCNGEVSESDELNNESTLDTTVVNNGYKGKRYTGGDDINTWKTFELNGNLVYSLGDSYYLSAYYNPDWTEYNAGWTASDLPIPGTATIVTARLFVPYTWDKAGVMPAYVDVSFNGNAQTLDAHYSDEKSWGTSYPYGMLVYDVTADFDTSGNVANLTNSCPGGDNVSMRGMLLVVVYADDSEPERTIILNEEFDLLYGGASKCTTPEEATAYAPFGSIDVTEVKEATLITVAPGAGDPAEGDLSFNGHMWYDVWNYVGSGTPTPQIGIAETNVTSYLEAADNEANFRSSADYMEASNAFLVVEYETVYLKSDLIVSEITPNCGGYLFASESNEICAKIENIGGGDAGAFNVSFVIDGFSTEVRISGLAAGANTTVCINDTTIRNAGDSVTITVTADCNGEVSESDELNNESTLDTTVVNNGYKGKRYTGGDDINTWKTFELNGNLVYSLGDSYYLSAYYNPDWTEYNAGWTASDLPIPGTATIVTARLFVPYTWDKAGVMPAYVDVSFNGNAQTLDAHYSDEKSWGTSYPYGMLVYDVTADFDTSGNVANLTNSCPGGDNVSMRGMLLVVVYADDSEPERTIILNEEFDLLYGGASKCTTPEEATAYAPFGSIDVTEVKEATLITVAPGAGDPAEGDLSFNGHMWYDVWNYVGSGTPTPQIGIAETNVTSYLEAADNEANFRSSADYMEASNAFLVVEYETVYLKSDLIVSEITPNCGGYLFASESNEICAKIENIGGGDAGAFNVSFVIDGFSTEVRISGLAAGANTTVCINDTTIRNAGDSVTITVTADCNGEVSESDELNNESTLDTTVVNNGYKGKRYTGGDDINTWKTFELNGNLVYSLGDSYYLSAYYNPDWTEYNAGWTASDLPIPGTATIVTARLFVPYTWDKVGVMPAYVDVSFNGNAQTLDAHYSDEKSWGTSYPYGMLVYDVTADFEVSGNVANLTNSCPGGDNVSMRGMLLVVVYADDSEPERTIILNEEFDLLYGGASKCTTPEEATAYAPFGSIDVTEVKEATLITVAPGAGDPAEGDQSFNGHMWYDVWNYVGSGTPTPQIGIAETNVTSYLEAANNEANFRSSADYMEASNAFLVVEYETVYLKSDLIVSEITPNCGGYLFASESNEICAKIENIGGGDAGAFNVSFVIDGFSTEVRISGLAAGANTTVCINDTTIRNAGDSVTITVTADCNGEVSESDELNNESTLDTTVVNNGYKGKRYTGGDDINTWKTFELNGNLVYSLGDSYYLSAYYNPDWTEYNAGWTASDLPIPGTATIVTARLFVPYTWDKVGVMPAYVDVSFNGNAQTLDAHYSDEKSWGTSYPYGMLVYDVTADFEGSGNVANLTNSCPGGDNVSMRGMLLVVVYADDSEPERTIILNEEFDLLYGGSSKCTTPEEATAYAPFGSIDMAGVEKATLITVAPGAGDPAEGDLSFNGHMWYDVWNYVGSGTPTPQIGIAETDVTSYLEAADNEANFQSSADWMEASNAFLILEKPLQNPLWHEINEELDALITNVSAANMPNIIKQRLINKLEYAKQLKDNAKMVCEEGNFAGSTKKLGVAKSQVVSFASMVKITRRISSADKASFLAGSTEIKGEIEALIEYIETEHEC